MIVVGDVKRIVYKTFIRSIHIHMIITNECSGVSDPHCNNDKTQIFKSKTEENESEGSHKRIFSSS